MDQDERDERDEQDVCSACGARIDTGAAGVFGFGTENVLCAQCAQARGGRYDATRDHWDVDPDVSGLGDEAYGAAPHEREPGRRK